MNKYVGHPSQLYDVEEVQLLSGGKGMGMRLLKVRNASGISFEVCPECCMDISRLFFKGDNVGYFTACGYVSPAYYQEKDFLKSFTAGFLTTCGLENAGPACNDQGKNYPQHGTISNIPCEHFWWDETEEDIRIHGVINDGSIFGNKLRLYRTIVCKKYENKIMLSDRIENYGDKDTEIMLLYHVNLGYPMLCNDTKLWVYSNQVLPCDAHAAEDLVTWNRMIPPTKGFEEQCYFHIMNEVGIAKVYNPMLKKGMVMSFDVKELPHFTQWKQMGEVDYVLGLEPGTCNPLGRIEAREQSQLIKLAPYENKEFHLHFEFMDKEEGSCD